ncbi:hypothetical protein SNEBB_009806 [Seison nebaliae]|nr:hypothetical protein SNEBB_009806 [Seison nebaliae]
MDLVMEKYFLFFLLIQLGFKDITSTKEYEVIRIRYRMLNDGQFKCITNSREFIEHCELIHLFGVRHTTYKIAKANTVLEHKVFVNEGESPKCYRTYVEKYLNTSLWEEKFPNTKSLSIFIKVIEKHFKFKVPQDTSCAIGINFKSGKEPITNKTESFQYKILKEIPHSSFWSKLKKILSFTKSSVLNVLRLKQRVIMETTDLNQHRSVMPFERYMLKSYQNVLGTKKGRVKAKFLPHTGNVQYNIGYSYKFKIGNETFSEKMRENNLTDETLMEKVMDQFKALASSLKVKSYDFSVAEIQVTKGLDYTSVPKWVYWSTIASIVMLAILCYMCSCGDNETPSHEPTIKLQSVEGSVVANQDMGKSTNTFSIQKVDT